MKHLIDRLQIAQGNNNADELIPEVIEMLRQQQAEIEALKVKAHEWYLIAMEKAQEK